MYGPARQACSLIPLWVNSVTRTFSPKLRLRAPVLSDNIPYCSSGFVSRHRSVSSVSSPQLLAQRWFLNLHDSLSTNAGTTHLQYEAPGIDTHESFAIGISARASCAQNCVKKQVAAQFCGEGLDPLLGLSFAGTGPDEVWLLHSTLASTSRAAPLGVLASWSTTGGHLSLPTRRRFLVILVRNNSGNLWKLYSFVC